MTAALLLGAEAAAGDLLFPVACTLGRDCVIQQYVDRDPGTGTADFTCGTLTYDGHRGTDIRLLDIAQMRAGVDVISATPGVVVAVRDGMPDELHSTEDLTGRECGNGAIIQRRNGWRYLYCHLQQGSLTVKKGQVVAAGDQLGRVGLSGQTQSPHLHLTVFDPEGRVIDPFDARQQDESCQLRERESLWRDIDHNVYQAGGALTAGFLDRMPDYDEVKDGSARRTTLPATTEAVLFWAHFFGLRDGDRIALTVTGPDGAIVAENTHRMTRAKAAQFRAVGRRSETPWPAGTYRGAALLIRGNSVISRIEGKVVVGPGH